MKIIKAKISDARRISYLIRKNIKHVTENNFTPQQIKAWQKGNTPKIIKNNIKQREVFCYFENNQLIGTIGLDKNEIAGFYMSASKRNKGIGKKLLTFIEEHARTKGIKELTLTSIPSATEFYKRNGYKHVENIVVKFNGATYNETTMKKAFSNN